MAMCVGTNSGVVGGLDRVDAPAAEGHDLQYAQLRLELVRLARRVVGAEGAGDLVQRVFLHVVRSGPAAPRDARGLPRPAYLASLVHALAASPGPMVVEAGLCAEGGVPVFAGDAAGARGG